ncbi:MAG: hypothetical protein Q9207_008548, partial [Kuettlingeria erythrocarpa]
PFSSPIFEIVAGSPLDNTKTFHAHAFMLSKSPVLKTAVEGIWRESSEKKIAWPHWSVDAAEKFLEWLYGGDYVCAYPRKVAGGAVDTGEVAEALGLSAETSASGKKGKGKKNGGFCGYDSFGDQLSEPQPQPVDEAVIFPTLDEDWGTFSNFGSSTKKSKSKRQPAIQNPPPPPALTRLQDLTFPGCRPLAKISQAEEFDKWTGHQLWTPAELDYETTFLTHAELYVMATAYMLEELKNMAWQRLRSVLISIGKPAPGSRVVDNLASLSRYVYAETGGGGGGVVEEEPLRMLVSGFAGLHFTCLKGKGMEELFMSGVEGDREFVVDLMGKVARQMAYLEAKEDSFQSVYTSVE